MKIQKGKVTTVLGLLKRVRSQMTSERTAWCAGSLVQRARTKAGNPSPTKVSACLMGHIAIAENPEHFLKLTDIDDLQYPETPLGRRAALELARTHAPDSFNGVGEDGGAYDYLLAQDRMTSFNDGTSKKRVLGLVDRTINRLRRKRK